LGSEGRRARCAQLAAAGGSRSRARDELGRLYAFTRGRHRDVREGYAITAASRELNDLARREGRERDERDTLRSRADKERQLANSLPFIGRSAGELAEISEELDRALQIIAGSPVTWAKIIDDLPEKEITRRTGLNHNQIQGIVRRVLEKTRKALDKPDDPGTSGGTLRPAATHSRSVGPPRDEGV